MTDAETLVKLRQNATLARVFTDLERAGWTIEGIRHDQISCTHPQVDRACTLIEAQTILREMK